MYVCICSLKMLTVLNLVTVTYYLEQVLVFGVAFRAVTVSGKQIVHEDRSAIEYRQLHVTKPWRTRGVATKWWISKQYL